MKHPAHFFVRYLLVRNPQIDDAMLKKTLQDWGYPLPEDTYFAWTRAELPKPDDTFNPLDFSDRASMRYLRDVGVYEMFRNTAEVQEAWAIMGDQKKRVAVEHILMARAEKRRTLHEVNKKNGWFLTVAGVEAFEHFFWNVNLLTFDEWGRFLYQRSAMYDRYIALLQADSSLAMFHLRIEQAVESKNMIKRAQEIAYFTLEEVNAKPGTSVDKVKAIQVLGKTLVECHEALSTSDMALKDVLKQFERFRMEHGQPAPVGIHELAPKGNYTGSGAAPKDELPN